MAARIPAFLLLTALGAPPSAAQELEEVSFGTNWLAQAEHGGFYQAVADGTYEACGLDVSIVSGGPQVNNRALMLAGRLDFYMSNTLLALDAAARDIPAVTVAAIFQKDPQVILAHPQSAETFEDLKDLTLLIGNTGYASFYQWMIAAHGFTAEQREPYTFNVAPFLTDPEMGMQGFVTSEPYTVSKKADFEPRVFLLAEHGYSVYNTTIETMREALENRPEVVRCFVEGSIKGWYEYLYGNPSPANELIQEANPEMTDERLAYARETMKSEGIVDSGKSLEDGIGAISTGRIEDFYQKMVDAGVVEDGIDWQSTFTTDFVNEGVGMDIKTTN